LDSNNNFIWAHLNDYIEKYLTKISKKISKKINLNNLNNLNNLDKTQLKNLLDTCLYYSEKIWIINSKNNGITSYIILTDINQIN
jgi:hypothetical protein